MAKPNYSFEKRQRDLAKKAKQEEKRRQKLANKAAGATGTTDAASPETSEDEASAVEAGSPEAASLPTTDADPRSDA